MAIIQMINDIVHDVTATGDELEMSIVRARRDSPPIVKLELAADIGGGSIWVNADAISSFTESAAS